MSFLNNFVLLLKARYPIIYISTYEEERVESARVGVAIARRGIGDGEIRPTRDFSHRTGRTGSAQTRRSRKVGFRGASVFSKRRRRARARRAEDSDHVRVPKRTPDDSVARGLEGGDHDRESVHEGDGWLGSVLGRPSATDG